MGAFTGLASVTESCSFHVCLLPPRGLQSLAQEISASTVHTFSPHKIEHVKKNFASYSSSISAKAKQPPREFPQFRYKLSQGQFVCSRPRGSTLPSGKPLEPRLQTDCQPTPVTLSWSMPEQSIFFLSCGSATTVTLAQRNSLQPA